MTIEFFSADELKCKGSGIIKLDPRFAEALPELRRAWGEPMSPSSVCRSPEHNRASGGNPDSLHLTENTKWPTLGAMAADIRWRDWPAEKQLRFARIAWRMGWAIGLHQGFCHIDRRADLKLRGLPQWVFLYGAWDGRFTRPDITK